MRSYCWLHEGGAPLTIRVRKGRGGAVEIDRRCFEARVDEGAVGQPDFAAQPDLAGLPHVVQSTPKGVPWLPKSPGSVIHDKSLKSGKNQWSRGSENVLRQKRPFPLYVWHACPTPTHLAWPWKGRATLTSSQLMYVGLANPTSAGLDIVRVSPWNISFVSS